jgi:hypothetical protein
MIRFSRVLAAVALVLLLGAHVRGRARGSFGIQFSAAALGLVDFTGAVFDNLSIDTAPTPEPATLWLLGTDAAALARYRRHVQL